MSTSSPASRSASLGFGRHRGWPMVEVPGSYLLWVWEGAEGVEEVEREKVRGELLRRLRGVREEAFEKLLERVGGPRPSS